MPEDNSKPIPKIQFYGAVLWPSFLIAAIASGLFFSTFDPLEIMGFVTSREISRLGVYTIGFMIFWALAILSSLGTALLCKPCNLVDPPRG
ncbi:MAG: hypothetical protein EP297_04200 [Gammaproteobacteria bacterium]|nr:MAG: hypothetical protein EP297_04200 [Gammaproteobacteria bacterium]